MSKKESIGPARLPRAATKRRREREEKAKVVAAATPPPRPEPAPAPAPPPAPGLKRPDLLADFIKSEQKTVAAKVAAPCQHKHLAFTKMGAVLKCIDCKRCYHILMETGAVPDAGYFNPSISDLESRHTPYEAPRITPESK